MIYKIVASPSWKRSVSQRNAHWQCEIKNGEANGGSAAQE